MGRFIKLALLFILLTSCEHEINFTSSIIGKYQLEDYIVDELSMIDECRSQSKLTIDYNLGYSAYHENIFLTRQAYSCRPQTPFESTLTISNNVMTINGIAYYYILQGDVLILTRVNPSHTKITEIWKKL